jgi:hypothetical protein
MNPAVVIAKCGAIAELVSSIERPIEKDEKNDPLFSILSFVHL